MKLLVSAWIPRSFLHVFEVNKSIDKFGLTIRNVRVGNEVKFDILKYGGYSKIEFSLDGGGQYSLLFDNVDNIEKTIKKAKYLILENIIKNSHKVTYKQIKDNALPLMFSSAVISGTDPKPDLPMKGAGKLKVYYDITKKFSGDSIAYIVGDRNAIEAAEYFNFTACSSSFLYTMMDNMSKYYNKADEVVNSLETTISLVELKKTVFTFDLLKKNVGESFVKVKQMEINLSRKLDEYESSKMNPSIKKLLDLDGAFHRLDSDRLYIESLWELLISYLGNIDSAAEARLSFQESIESKKIEGLLSIESASVIASLLMAIFITEFTGVGAAMLFASFIVIWFLMYFIIVKIRPKKKEFLSLSK